MSVRALAAAVIVLAASLANADEPWRAAVVPPRPGLPAVTADVGYPGGYVPWVSVPVVLRATAGDRPFDGYLGLHFRVNEHVWFDTPIIARAVLRPHETWTFSTFASLRRFGVEATGATREVAIEWRDATTKIIATKSAGTPPWTMSPEPLRIARPGENFAGPVLGRTPYVASALSDRAQWYAGFSDAVVPLDLWLDLPRRVREAILGSGIHVVFFGFPRAGQRFDDLDRALLPVTVAERTATAKPDTDSVGTPPAVVRSDAAAWCADDAAVAPALPDFVSRRVAMYEAAFVGHKSTSWPRPSQVARLYRALLTSVFALGATIAAWLMLRRRQRAIAVVVIIAVAAVPLALRARVRPPAATYVMEMQSPIAPGIVRTLRITRMYGPRRWPSRSRTRSGCARASLARTTTAIKFGNCATRERRSRWV